MYVSVYGPTTKMCIAMFNPFRSTLEESRKKGANGKTGKQALCYTSQEFCKPEF